MKPLTSSQVQAFRKKIYSHYWQHNRNSLPWRKTKNPYDIFISEIMLQQTQVQRVIPKYHEFLKRFPNFSALASAPMHDVLKVWSGLGYNRRALLLKKAAEKIISEFHGKIPENQEILTALPGIGTATAGQILAFAFNKPSVFIETNIRTVFIHEFFSGKKTMQEKVHDQEILPLVEQTLDTHSAREWYFAVFDYGVMLKKQHPNPSRESIHHTLQNRFEGSNRQARGKILKALTQSQSKKGMTEKQMQKETTLSRKKVLYNLNNLIKEGLVVKKGRQYSLPS